MTTQYYTPNKLFQISSLEQLKSVDKTEYTWEGRTLTGWLDSENRVHEISSDAEISTSFPNMTAEISGLWELNKLKDSLSVVPNENDIDGTGGILCVIYRMVNQLTDYLPLHEPKSGQFTLSSNETKNERYYNTHLCICLSAKDGFIPTKLSFYDKRLQVWTNVKNPQNVVDFDNRISTDDGGSFDQSYLKCYDLSVVAEFNKGILTYYSGKNTPSPV